MRRHQYYLKTDIVRFFPNVDHEVLLGVIGQYVADERLMDLIRRVVASGAGLLADEATDQLFPGDDLFALLRPRGLPIGNLTSQFFANVLLDAIDHFIKEELQVPGYVRYADDLVLFGESKSQLWKCATRWRSGWPDFGSSCTATRRVWRRVAGGCGFSASCCAPLAADCRGSRYCGFNAECAACVG